MNEHAKNLRRTRADMLGTEDNDHYLECQRAAAYIERLHNICEYARNEIKDQRAAIKALEAELEKITGGEVDSVQAWEIADAALSVSKDS